jgi:UDP-N-acetylglucosamine 2-epimerase (hydrolysing)
MRFEYFLTLLKNSSIIVGNSSSGVIEAPFYGIPTINIGSRQNLRSDGKSIINATYHSKKLEKLINHFYKKKFKKNNDYGYGNSDKKITSILKNKKIWKTPLQKQLSEY